MPAVLGSGFGNSVGFLKDHLLKWARRFFKKMCEMADLDFYRGLTKLTSCFLKGDSHLIEEQLKDLQHI